MSLCAMGTPWLAAPALDRGETQLLLPVLAWGGPAGRWLRLQELRGHPGDTQDGGLGSRLQPCARVSPRGAAGWPRGVVGSAQLGRGVTLCGTGRGHRGLSR